MLAGKKRQFALGIVVVITAVVVGFVIFMARPATEPAPPAEPVVVEPAAAQAPTEAVDAEVEALPPSRQHVRKSNVRLLHPPEKKDFSKMSVPAAETPTAEE